jgi:hypothetical protein
VVKPVLGAFRDDARLGCLVKAGSCLDGQRGPDGILRDKRRTSPLLAKEATPTSNTTSTVKMRSTWARVAEITKFGLGQSSVFMRPR